MAEPLHRSSDDRMLAGVAAGLAETLDADPSVVRILWALLAILTGGIAIVVYIVMAIVVPEGPGRSPGGSPSTGGIAGEGVAGGARRHRTRDPGEAGLILGVLLIVIGGLFLVRQAIPWFDLHVWWPLGIVGLGLLLILAAVRPGRPGA